MSTSNTTAPEATTTTTSASVVAASPIDLTSFTNTMPTYKGSLTEQQKSAMIGQRFTAELGEPIHQHEFDVYAASRFVAADVQSFSPDPVLGHYITVNLNGQILRGCIFNEQTAVTVNPIALAEPEALPQLTQPQNQQHNTGTDQNQQQQTTHTSQLQQQQQQ